MVNLQLSENAVTVNTGLRVKTGDSIGIERKERSMHTSELFKEDALWEQLTIIIPAFKEARAD